MTTETKNLGGRPPLPPEEVKSFFYKFRVNQAEKDLLEEVGDNTFWRQFCVNVATIIKYESAQDSIRSTVVSVKGLLEHDEEIKILFRKILDEQEKSGTQG